MTATRLEATDGRSVTLSTGARIPARTVCWTAGVKPSPVTRELGLPLAEGGRIATDRFLNVEGLERVWAIGDAAEVPDPAQRNGAPCPPTAQHAMRQGRRVARNIAARIRGGAVRPSRYPTLGLFVDLGRNKAVARILGQNLQGTPAWLAGRTYHLLMMPGSAPRLRLMANGTVGSR